LQWEIRAEVDWVKAHFDCSLEHAWITLRERIKSDISRWKELSGAKDYPTLTDESG
jgi:hypothetical protein